MKNLVVGLFFLFCLSKCKNKEKVQLENPSELIYVSNNSLGPIYFEKYFEEDKVLPLELVEEDYIGSIDEVSFYEDKYYIADNTSRSLFIFDSAGKHIKKIAPSGTQYKQLQSVHAFFLNKDKRRIEISDISNGKMIFYDLNGDFIEEKKVRFPILDFTFDESAGMYYVYSGYLADKRIVGTKDNFRVLYCDSNFQVVSGFLPYEYSRTNDPTLHGRNLFFNFDGAVYFCESSRSKIYKFQPEQVEVYRDIEYSNGNLPTDFNSDPNPLEDFSSSVYISNKGESNVNGHVFTTGDLIVDSNVIIFSSGYQNSPFIAINFRKSNTTVSGNVLHNDKHGMPIRPMIQLQGSKFLSYIQPSELTNRMVSQMRPNSWIKTYLNSVSDYKKLGPILLFFKLKTDSSIP